MVMVMDDADPVSTCKDKLMRFRLKELKDVLNQLGLSKQGKKQELTDRILASLFQEQETDPRSNSSGSVSISASRIIEETYRKMFPETSDAPAGAGPNKVSRAKKEEGEVSSSEKKVRCPCDSSVFTSSMVKCVDTQCNIWQHIGCVIVPENVAEGVAPAVPPNFYCEMCRVARADPFWVAVRYPLVPVIVDPCLPSVDGKPAVQIIEKGFHLSSKDREMLRKDGHELQVWSLLLNDNVPFRMHWPLYSELHVNGLQMRVMPRPSQQPLGCNGRDDCPLIGTCCREGYNKIVLSRADSRKFCLAVRIARRRNLNEVLTMIPKEEKGEKYEDALARVRRCIGGGTATENADDNDSDSDIELVSDSVTVNLRCPMSGLRMKVAGRFKPCAHMGCFDLETFVSLNERARKWQCPICLKNHSLESIIIDPYFNRITTLMTDCKEDTNEIEIKSDGSWRVKTSDQFKDLEKWHLPDGSLCPPSAAKPSFSLHAGSEIKQEIFLEANLGETKPSIQKLQSETNFLNLESAVGISGLNGHGSQSLERETDVELIVLSDSDDDNVMALDPPVVHEQPIPNGETGFGIGGPSCYELLTGEPDDFNISDWDYPQNYSQVGPVAGEQFFDEAQHQVQDAATAMNGNGRELDINSNGISDHPDYWSSFNLQDHSNPMDLDYATRPGPCGNLSGEDSTAQTLADAAAVLHNMNAGNCNDTQRANGPTLGNQTQSRYSTFSPPRQLRSAKRRVIVSIDSDSE